MRHVRLALVATPRDNSDIERVLVVSAHPDDADFGAGGTIAAWVAAGLQVTELYVTRGEQGGRPDVDPGGIPLRREAEQRAASARRGVHDVRFLEGHRDGWVAPTPELVRDLVAVIREVRPQRVLCQSPERNYERLHASHPDHLAAGEAIIRAVYPAAENPFAWPELGLPFWHVGEIWLAAHPAPDHVVDVTDTFDQKVAALHEHASQTGHREELETFLRGWASSVASAQGLPEGRLAEVFKVIALN